MEVTYYQPIIPMLIISILLQKPLPNTYGKLQYILSAYYYIIYYPLLMESYSIISILLQKPLPIIYRVTVLTAYYYKNH